MYYGIYPVTVERVVEGESVAVGICPDCARKSLDGTKWICNDPQNSPQRRSPCKC